jgi:triosephosphate isomerase
MTKFDSNEQEPMPISLNNGGLIGGASLDASAFIAIVEAATMLI